MVLGLYSSREVPEDKKCETWIRNFNWSRVEVVSLAMPIRGEHLWAYKCLPFCAGVAKR